MLRKLLFRMAKSPWMGKIVGLTFQYISWAIPVKRIIPSKDVFVFAHPQPCYPNHLILSPKRPIRILQQLAAEHSTFAQIWSAAMEVHVRHPEVYHAFTLVANGGKRQEVQQVHFHLFTDHPLVNETSGERVLDQDEELCILQPLHPEWEVHLILKPAQASQDAYFRSVLRSIDRLNDRFDIVQKGYSLVYQHNPQNNDREMPVFHIVSGKKHA